MTVKEIMQTSVATCLATDDVATAVAVMRRQQCGFLPVIDGHGRVAGIVTDRGLCIAASERDRPAGHVAVAEAMSRPVFNCLPDENLKAVLATMAKHRVRRLPVIDRQGHLQGVLSIDDIVRAPRRRGAPTAEEIVDALKGICAPRPIETSAA